MKGKDPEKVLVTGGAGFIGSHLVEALASWGCNIRILDNLSSGKLENVEDLVKNGSVELIRGDIRNPQDAKEALKGISTVFHLAAITSVPYSVMNPTITTDVNVRGTRSLLDASISSGVESFLYVSSCAVYGEPQYLPIDEDHRLDPMSPYAESKVKGEEYCSEYLRKYGLRTSSFRLFNVYGLRQIGSENSGVITRFIESIRKGNPPTIYGDGNQTRDFVHVRDVVQALLLSMNNDNVIGQVFNIGSGQPVTVNQLCRLILRQLKANLKPVYEKPRGGDIKNSYANIEKARRMLAYQPEISLEKGLESLIGHRK